MEDIMNDINNSKLNSESLEQVTGGNDGMGEYFSVIDIVPIWVKVRSSSLYCRYTPNGEIAKVFEHSHKLKVDGITTDGLWYRTMILDPMGGECAGYVFKEYTEEL